MAAIFQWMHEMVWIANAISCIFAFIAAWAIFRWGSFLPYDRSDLGMVRRAHQAQRLSKITGWCLVFVCVMQAWGAVARFIAHYWG